MLRALWSLAAVLCLTGCSSGRANVVVLRNVSYDPTRELYEEINRAFAAKWERETGQRVEVEQSHGGSGKQARSVLEGLEADVVTLALASDIDAIAAGGLLAKNWRARLPKGSVPFASTIVFVVRKGNPRGIRDWDDLVRPGIEVITPNPKSSGGARWNYVAAWGYALRRAGGDEARAKEFLTAMYRNVPVLDTGARASTMTFAQREIGDVLLSWESEAMMAVREFGPSRLEIVVPSVSVLAETPVALVDACVDRRGTRRLAEAYLQFLYSEEAQQAAARHFFRPLSAVRGGGEFAAVPLFRLEEISGGWAQFNAAHFARNGWFDRIYMPAGVRN